MSIPRFALAVMLGLVVFAGGCPVEDDGASEQGPPRDVPFTLSAALPDGARADGWTIALTRAEIAVGQPTFYGNSTYDTVARRSPSWFGVPTAFAHAGHAHGEADAEAAVEGTHVVDLLTPEPAVLGTLSMAPALYFDGKLRLEKAIDGHSLILEGTATDPEGAAHDLEIIVDVEGWVAGLELDFLVASDTDLGALLIEVRLDTLLADIDLAAIETPEGALRLGPESGDSYLSLKAAIQNPLVYAQADLLN